MEMKKIYNTIPLIVLLFHFIIGCNTKQITEKNDIEKEYLKERYQVVDFNSEDWILFENENIIYHNVTKTEKIIVKDLTIYFIWDEKLSKNKF